MAQTGATPPNLPLAPNEYDRRYVDQLNNVLRLYFTQLSNPGTVGATTLNLDLRYLPTDLDFDTLRVGDVYRDTQDGTQTGSQMLRIKTSS